MRHALAPLGRTVLVVEEPTLEPVSHALFVLLDFTVLVVEVAMQGLVLAVPRAGTENLIQGAVGPALVPVLHARFVLQDSTIQDVVGPVLGRVCPALLALWDSTIQGALGCLDLACVLRVLRVGRV